jgi:hypothetical protein
MPPAIPALGPSALGRDDGSEKQMCATTFGTRVSRAEKTNPSSRPSREAARAGTVIRIASDIRATPHAIPALGPSALGRDDVEENGITRLLIQLSRGGAGMMILRCVAMR